MGEYLFTEVIDAFDRCENVDAEREVSTLRDEVVLPEKLNRLAGRAVHANLSAAEQPEPIFETDERAVVEAEEVVDEITEIPAPQRPREAVRDPERALVPGHAQCRGKRAEREIGLCKVDVAIRIVFLRRCRWWCRGCGA